VTLDHHPLPPRSAPSCRCSCCRLLRDPVLKLCNEGPLPGGRGALSALSPKGQRGWRDACRRLANLGSPLEEHRERSLLVAARPQRRADAEELVRVIDADTSFRVSIRTSSAGTSDLHSAGPR
jgi:hypothetical protein